MRRTITRLCALVVFALGLVACSSSSTLRWLELKVDDFSKQPHHIRAATVAASDSILVTLISNPATGFTWPDVAQIHNEDILTQTDHKHVQPGQAGAAGAAGKEAWAFRALRKGTTTISMGYQRPWESVEGPLWTFAATITVE